MFTEGYETSSSVLAFAIYELARNQDIQERLYQEIEDVLAKYDGECPFEALQEMEYLDMVIHETMRLDVVAPLISRICTKEYTMPLIEGQKEPVKLQPGTAVQINCRSIHMLVPKSISLYFPWDLPIYISIQYIWWIRMTVNFLGIRNITQIQRYLTQIDLPKKSVEIGTRPFIYHLARDQEVMFKSIQFEILVFNLCILLSHWQCVLE